MSNPDSIVQITGNTWVISEHATFCHSRKEAPGRAALRAIAYVRNTEDALREHFVPLPVFQLLDGYQWNLLISAHSHRHTLQVLEVNANPNFPEGVVR